MDCANAQYPPITEAIRSRVESGWDPWPEAREWLLGKCDTIDAVHAQLERDYKLACRVNERQDLEYTQLKAERDSMAAALDRAEGEHDFAPESHYMMLPKDADGVPVHIGDVMEGELIGGGYGEPFTVVGYVMSNGELEPMDEHKNPRKRKYSHHHTPDTWEHIIEDAMTGYTDGEFDKLVARCKALAGDGTGGRNEHH